MALSSSGSTWMGGVDYLNNLGHAIQASVVSGGHQAKLYLIVDESSVQHASLYSDVVASENQVIVLPAETRIHRMMQRFRYSLYESYKAFSIYTTLAKYGIDFIYPTYMPPSNRYSISSAAWIPDFQHRHLPEFFHPKECAIRDFDFDRASRNASLTVLSSRDAKNDFLTMFPEREERVEVLPFRTKVSSEWLLGEADAVRRRFDLPRRFFIVCNQFWQHKNHHLILKALSLLRKRGETPFVVFTGGTQDYRKPEFVDRLLQDISEYGVSSQIRVLGILPRHEQVQLIRASLAVLQPSLFEGWSTVVEMARSLGKPIFLSNLAVHLEQAPLNSRYFDPLSPEELAHLLSIHGQRLEPGPHALEESQAAAQNAEDLRAFGQRFLEIAQRAKHSQSNIPRTALGALL